MKKLLSLLILFAMILSLAVGCSSDAKSSDGSKSDDDEEEQNLAEPVEAVIDEDFETVVYFYEDNGSTYGLLAVKNNSEKDREFYADLVARDEDGKELGTEEGWIEVLGAGEESYCELRFDGVTGIDTIDVSLDDDDPGYLPALSTLDVKSEMNENRDVTTTVKNNGGSVKDFHAHVVFFDSSGHVLAVFAAGLLGSEIQSGAELSGSVRGPKGSDHYKVFVYGHSPDKT